MVFLRDDIPVKFLSSGDKPINAFFFEFSFKKKWLVCCSYNSNNNNISRQLETLRKRLDLYSAQYENNIL